MRFGLFGCARTKRMTGITVERVGVFREECERIGRKYESAMVGATRALQMVHTEEEREAAA